MIVFVRYEAVGLLLQIGGRFFLLGSPKKEISLSVNLAGSTFMSVVVKVLDKVLIRISFKDAMRSPA